MATKKTTTAETSAAVTIEQITMKDLRVCIVGVTPLLVHAVSFKAASQLLFPAPAKNKNEREASLKHEPFEEFRDACYKYRDQDNEPTRLYLPGSMFHSAMASAALDLAGAQKAQIGRLTNIPHAKLPLFGIPQILSMIVRSSDMARTPDVRTLPILPQWALYLPIQFVDLIKEQSIFNLLGAAGDIIGVGDGRPQKGKLSYGKFRVCSEDDPEFCLIVKQTTRARQDEALRNPKTYDAETDQLLKWFLQEKTQRAARPVAAPKKRGEQPAMQA